MIEFDVDMSYLIECDELNKVVLRDENGEHEPIEFVPKDAVTAGMRSCAACPEMDNPDSYIFHLMMALEHERGCCRDCKHSHMTADGKHCKWCSVLATHKIDDERCCDPSNGYDPEPYFDADFYCGFFERRVDE